MKHFVQPFRFLIPFDYFGAKPKTGLAEEYYHIEKDVIKQVAAGDVNAFATFYRHYSDRVYATARSFIKNDPFLCEEIVQTAFIKIWENRARLATVERAGDYLFIIARNIIFDCLRHRDRQTAVHAGYQDTVAEPETPIALLATKEYKNIFSAAVAQLPDQQKKIYLLARQEAVPHAEIARQLGLTLQTVRTHLKLANRSVRQFVSQHLNDPELLPVLMIILAGMMD